VKTTDLCDQYTDLVRVAEPIGLKNFGVQREFHEYQKSLDEQASKTPRIDVEFKEQEK
jgi:hypothetical protein